MQKDQFEFQKKANEQTQTLNDIKIKQAEQQQVAKEKVGQLSTLLNDISIGNYDPETIVNRLDELDIDLTPLLDRTLKSAIDDLGQGKYDSGNPAHTDAVNFLMGPKVQQVVGMTGQNGEEIVSVRVVDIVPSPTNPEMLVPELAVQTSSGLTYRAPITQNRTANWMIRLCKSQWTRPFRKRWVRVSCINSWTVMICALWYKTASNK